jgi:hypothetical protein
MSARGGKRPGAGRPAGSGSGRNVITRSVSMLPESWEQLDHLRGDKSRGEWIAEKVKRSAKRATY